MLLLNESMTVPEMVNKIPYEGVGGRQIRRISKKGNKVDLFSVEGVPGTDRYQIKKSEFNQDQLEELNRRALLRIMDPTEDWGSTETLDEIPNEYFYCYDRNEVRCLKDSMVFEKQTDPIDIQTVFFSSKSSENRNNDIDSGDHMNNRKRKSGFCGMNKKPWKEE
jgi:hypothetical protein